MSELYVVIVAAAIAVVILRHPHLRSARSVVLIVGSATASLVLLRFREWPTDLAAFLIAWTPLLVAARADRWVTALPPADFDEHCLIASVRQSLRSGGSDTDARAADAIARLTANAPPAPQWQVVRDALMDQIALTREHLAGERSVTREEASESWTRTVWAWKRAIQERRRFLR